MTYSGRFAETGQALVSSVDKVIFVGSPGVGRMVCYLFISFLSIEWNSHSLAAEV